MAIHPIFPPAGAVLFVYMVLAISKIAGYLDLLDPLEVVRQSGGLLVFHCLCHLLVHLLLDLLFLRALFKPLPGLELIYPFLHLLQQLLGRLQLLLEF